MQQCRSKEAALKPLCALGSNICHQLEVWKSEPAALSRSSASRGSQLLWKSKASRADNAELWSCTHWFTLTKHTKNLLKKKQDAKKCCTMPKHIIIHSAFVYACGNVPCGQTEWFDRKMWFPVAQIPWLECDHRFDHLVNSNVHNQIWSSPPFEMVFNRLY